MSEERIKALKSELKEWEREFAEVNDGKKPSREDIKRNPDIAAKYKEYTKLRSAPPPPPPQPVFATPKKRNSTLLQSPHKAPAGTNLFKTPVKSPRKHELPPRTPSEYDSPVARRYRFARDDKTIDPTPQKQGRVLGIFESMLSPPQLFKSPPQPVFHTPTKKSSPASSQHSQNCTPRKRKLGDLGEFTLSPVKRTAEMPGTPDFLRRRTTVDFNPEMSPIARPFRAPPARSLSRMVKEINELTAEEKRQQEQALRDEEQALRDEEDAMWEAELGISTAKKSVERSSLPPPPQPVFAPGIFEDVPEEIEEQTDGKVWKKKGQKRQIRRVKIRPVKVGPVEVQEDDVSEDGEETNETEDRKEQDKEQPREGPEDGESDYGSDIDFDEGDEQEEEVGDENSPPTKKQKTADETGGDVDATKQKKGGLFAAAKQATKKAVKKVSSTAHANYKKLNIKSKGGSGKGRGRWGGRRR